MNRQVQDEQPGPQQAAELNLDSDEYFMALAFLCSQRRKGPKRPVGACIVSNGKVLSTGYCGMPDCCDEHKGQDSDDVCHAEKNAIFNMKEAGKGKKRMYVTLHPCGGCKMLMKKSRISSFVYYHTKFPPKKHYSTYRPYSETKNRSLTLDFSQPGKVLRPTEKTCGHLKLPDDEFFMSVAFLAATRSSLPTHERTGACLVDGKNNIIGIGYKAPRQLLWVEGPGKKNTIRNKNCSDLCGCSIYVTHFPSKECAEAIVKAGITTICFFYENADATDSASISASPNVEYVKYSVS